jgi:primosomal protein N' (replication factor Y)
MMNNHFADIILPLAVKGVFTYRIPEELDASVIPGVRVLVQFGNKKLCSGVVSNTHNTSPPAGNIRSVIRVLDPFPVANDIMLKFWSWISDYYMCSQGEVVKAAIPSILFPEGETSVPVIDKYKPRKNLS